MQLGRGLPAEYAAPLDGRPVAFGHVADGMDVVRKIEQSPNNAAQITASGEVE